MHTTDTHTRTHAPTSPVLSCCLTTHWSAISKRSKFQLLLHTDTNKHTDACTHRVYRHTHTHAQTHIHIIQMHTYTHGCFVLEIRFEWKLGSHYCIIESFFTAYLLCIFFTSFRCKLQFSSSFAADKDGWNGETYHSALYSLVTFYRTIFFLLFIMKNNVPLSTYASVRMREICVVCRGLTNQ